MKSLLKTAVARNNARFTIYMAVLALVLMGGLFSFSLHTLSGILQSSSKTIIIEKPFAVSVDPETETIEYKTDEVVLNDAPIIRREDKEGWWRVLTYQIASAGWFQSLATPGARTLVIWPGDRKEEVVASFGDILNWGTEERVLFLQLITEAEPYLEEGTFSPGKYLVASDASPERVAEKVRQQFANEVLNRYTEDVAARVPLKDALIIASLIEREAYAFDDMREISGVIWNRLFIDMKLQLDATLQYAKGSETDWWQVPTPKDKYIDSSYNTYQNHGLPPQAIANPSVSAIIAALNPNVTDCIFYFHYKNDLYCSEDYEQHVEKLRAIYGRGS